MLVKYRKQVEWFTNTELTALYLKETKKGEELLGMDLYKFLLQEGLSFTLESKSPSGLSDLYALQENNKRILAEVKVYNGHKSTQNKKYIIKGYKQIRRYMQDYNEPYGHLVIFNNTSDEFQLDGLIEIGGLPVIINDNKYVSIVIIQLEKLSSASKSYKRKKVILTKENFIKAKTE